MGYKNLRKLNKDYYLLVGRGETRTTWRLRRLKGEITGELFLLFLNIERV